MKAVYALMIGLPLAACGALSGLDDYTLPIETEPSTGGSSGVRTGTGGSGGIGIVQGVGPGGGPGQGAGPLVGGMGGMASGGQAPVGGMGGANPIDVVPCADVQDGFNNINGNQWAWILIGQGSNVMFTTNDHRLVSQRSGFANQYREASIVTLSAWPFDGCATIIEANDVNGVAELELAYLSLGPDLNNFFGIGVSQGFVLTFDWRGVEITQHAIMPHDANSRWWAITPLPQSDVVEFHVSPDGVTWTRFDRRSIPLSEMSLRVTVGAISFEGGDGGQSFFDNLNLP